MSLAIRDPSARFQESPEAELLVCSAGARHSPEMVARIRELLSGELDWTCVLELARAHGIVPLLELALRTVEPGGVPDGHWERLREWAAADAVQNRALVTELLRLLPALEVEKIPALAYKGPEHAAATYGDLSLRPFGDLDLLVEQRDVTRTKALLAAHGYEERQTLLWQSFLQNPERLGVDLHWKLAPRWDPVPGSFGELWSRARAVSVDGRMVSTLSVEDLLLVIAVQLAMDCRVHRQRLIQVCDAAELIRSNPSLDWTSVLVRAEQAGARRVLLLALSLARELLGVPLPEPVLAAVARERTLLRLTASARAGFARMPVRAAAEPGDAERRQPADHRFYLGVRERLRDRAVYLYIMRRPRIGLWLKPSARDRAFVRLPRGLGFLYYVVRPIRVLQQWVRTGHPTSRARP